ncbi:MULTISPECIES: efflux RND transporter permease subunit [Idiomarina]|jgi:CzcA family heavy metal efflux pump|uniref:Efflux RND transporter permease subunit n=1 Tax=Idiomarina abyssalis TaxID=86102 RepID=A0A8I1G7T5_9GAMM|nr:MULTISPECIES: efflux RND transporter permease subunit [Idiomarina]MBJ7266419.1 efflux RND transporter permease subunit [Idiomarina abyssalis]MBJ7274297.1 efflux RND transporter permease subunit [Idiomarina abyssalis]MBJ7314795.1 efflux RND transporter permease subunit [Idiomarina abyssalis]MBP59279.1 CusA/CzcA family heavy metal efflux RND transporter [Idiomarina sp.]|tara:strand:+ start:6431 stop:9508 length:3078 start_codon:yes stop_codon:yes gene_type:complete
MIDRIIQWSLHNRLIVIALALVLLIWGGYSTIKAPVDVFPDLTAPSVTIVTEAHGMPPEDVEKLITFPIESAMNGASGVRRVRSNSGIGISVVTVEFDWETDVYLARQMVSERLQTLQNELPADVGAPQMAPVSSIMGEIMFLALTSEAHSEIELKTTADYTIRRRLLAVPGVAEVISTGGQVKQYQVVAKPDALIANDLSLDDVTKALEGSNMTSSAGFVKQNQQEFLIQGMGRIESQSDIEQTVIANRGGIPVLVQDIANVEVGPALRRGTAAFNGRSGVVLGIQKQPNTNTLELTDDLDRVINDINQSLPEGMTLQTDTFRQSDFIETSIGNLNSALRDGAILVVAIMFIFLFSARATGIALVAIPLSLLVAVLTIRHFGGSLNTMTLGGMTIALGALVDDAIIVVENVVKRLRENLAKPAAEQLSKLKVIAGATREIESSIVFATFIIVLVFLPLFFLQGVEGRLLQPLGVAYIVSILASLLVAITITPVLSYYGLSGSKSLLASHDTRFISALKASYRPILNGSLQRPKLLLSSAGVLLLIALLAVFQFGRGFLPEFNEGSLTVSVVTVPGTSLEKSDAIGERVERILLDEPEVVATTRRTGRAERDPHAQQVFASEIDVKLSMQSRSKEALLESLRQEFFFLTGVNVIIGQPISHRIDHMLSGTRANIAIKLFGNELYKLRQLGAQIESLVKEVPGAVDVAMDQQAEIPFITFDFKRAQLAQYGMSIEQASHALETAFAGTSASRILEEQATFDLVVRYPYRYREDIESLKNTMIKAPNGAVIPFSAIADINKTRGANTITRENVQRNLVVMANVSGRDLIGVVDDIEQRIAQSIDLPTGYYIEFGGQFESAESANTRLMLLGIGVIIGIYLLLLTAFNSAKEAFLVMLNLPLALIGGVAGIYFAGGVINIAVIIGFITLFGIATRNGVILVDYIKQLMAKGVELTDAIKQASEERLVPILMTALATALALIPLSLGLGEPGSEIQAPMAIVILWGLISSTVLNMVIVPAGYFLLNRHK